MTFYIFVAHPAEWLGRLRTGPKGVGQEDPGESQRFHLTFRRPALTST